MEGCGIGRVRQGRTGRTVFPPEAHSISRGESGSDRLAELGELARGRTESDRVGQSRTVFPGSAFYIAKREWIRPIGRIGRISAGKDGSDGVRQVTRVLGEDGSDISDESDGVRGRVGRVGPGERRGFQNVNVLFAMIASEIKLVKLD